MVTIGIVTASIAAIGIAASRCPLLRAIRAHVSLVAATR